MKNKTHSRQRVLIVGKESRIRRVCDEVLTRSGFSVDTVPDGAHAVSSILGNRYDLCIMDILAPGIDGNGLYAWLNNYHPEPVRGAIITTGDISGDYRPALAADRGHVFLQKPFTPEELLAAVEMALN